jgi:hypothetical protein
VVCGPPGVQGAARCSTVSALYPCVPRGQTRDRPPDGDRSPLAGGPGLIYDPAMSSGRQLALWRRPELPNTAPRAFKIVVYRAAPAGAEVFLVRAGEVWALPEGMSTITETPREASERYLRERWGSDLATVEVDGGAALFATQADAADSGVFGPIGAGGEWFGLGKLRALRLGPDEAVVARLLESLG